MLLQTQLAIALGEILNISSIIGAVGVSGVYD